MGGKTVDVKSRTDTKPKIIEINPNLVVNLFHLWYLQRHIKHNNRFFHEKLCRYMQLKGQLE